MASNYDFRILIDTVSGSTKSFGTSSFVTLATNTSQVLNTSEVVEKINTLKSITYFNGETHETASSLYAAKGAFQISGSTGTDTNYQFISASMKGGGDSGSIVFHANSTPTSGGDYIKRYKFFGNKVCNVIGVPENYWIYADKFRLTNTGSEKNYISGDVLAQSIHLRDNFAISNAGSITSDLPMKHAENTDRWIKWQNVSGSLPQNDMLIGYGNQSNKYMIRMQNNNNLIISSSAVTASGNMRIQGDLILDNTTITATATELNKMDGGTAASNITPADTDRVVYNDNGTMKQVAISKLATYFDDEITAMPNLTSVGTLGSLTVTGNIIASGSIVGDGSTNITNINDIECDEIQHSGDPNTRIHFGTDHIYFDAGSTDYDKMRINSTGIVINEDSQDYDFRVESNDNTHMLFVDASANRVSIGDSIPLSTLHIQHTDTTTNAVTNQYSDYLLTLRNNTDTLNAFAGIAFDVSSETDADAIGAAIKGLCANTTANLHDTHLTFHTNDISDDDLTERMRITNDGNVGIGADTPTEKLQVEGNISASGHIYQSQYPAFSATVTGDDDIDDTDSTDWQSITFDKEIFDVGGDFDHTAGIPKFTAPVKGIYQFNLTVTIQNYDTGMDAFGIRLYTNASSHDPTGHNYDMNQVLEVDGSGEHHSFGFSKSLKLDVGDIVYPQHRSNDTSGTFDEAATLNSSLTDLTWFDGHLVTPLP
jgi:hypothetical protein